mmetsp:Transcript_25354/g.84981  ORF Transcript_25354/g.84981 Transcript_25354/m.84981 type:complete len:233 (+) Transcript_25354:640-1338(+)
MWDFASSLALMSAPEMSTRLRLRRMAATSALSEGSSPSGAASSSTETKMVALPPEASVEDLYTSSVTLRGWMAPYRRSMAPGTSAMRVAMSASRLCPRSARSATMRRRSKVQLAPEVMATRPRSCPMACAAAHFLRPAMARAPAGSRMARVSSKPSLTAAQISSTLTVIMSSTSSSHTRKVSSPTRSTAAPSAKRSTSSSTTRCPARSDRPIASAPTASTPITRVLGETALV